MKNTKKWLSILLLCAAALPLNGLAESDTAVAFTSADYVSLATLREQALSGWHESFTAQGRDVAVNVDVARMPQADACPIVQVEGQGQLNAEALARYKELPKTSVYASDYSLNVEAFQESPLAEGESGSYGGLLVNHQELKFYNGDVPTEQPENVDLSYDELLARIDAEIEPLSGQTLKDFQTKLVWVSDVDYKAKKNKQGEVVEGKPFSKWGCYYLEAQQLIHGIPVVGTSGDWMKTPKGTLYYYYSSPTYYHFTLSCSKEIAVVQADVPLLSFDALKRALTAQIEAGHLRGVDELEFGYMAFCREGQQGREWLMLPVWRMLGGYAADARSDKPVLPYTAADGSRVVPQEYNDYYLSAQTGELLPTDALLQNGSPNNVLVAGDVLTWDDVNGQ